LSGTPIGLRSLDAPAKQHCLRGFKGWRPGLLWRKQDQYRLTLRGRDELAVARFLIRLLVRGQGRC
jgi:hypothetical protein